MAKKIATLKQYKILPVNPKVPSSGYALNGLAYDYPNYRDGTRVETPRVIGRSEDKSKLVVESGRVWVIDKLFDEATPADVALTNEFIEKTRVLDFSINDDGIAVLRMAPTDQPVVTRTIPTGQMNVSGASLVNTPREAVAASPAAVSGPLVETVAPASSARPPAPATNSSPVVPGKAKD